MMNRPEAFARWIAFILVAGVIGVAGLARLFTGAQALEIHARMPEQGGWMPADLVAGVGEPLRLRFTSEDVVHGFAIGKSERPPIDIYPGLFSEVELTFEQPGTYTFYCTRWCGPNHWRMRGTIEVSGPPEEIQEQTTPLYLQLDLDIDAEHSADVIPGHMPNAVAGTEIEILLSPEYYSTDYYRTHSPAAVWNELRMDSATALLGDDQVWNLVAAIWLSNTTDQILKQGERLYAENCAACHGTAGDGRGVMANTTAEHSQSNEASISGHEILPPTDFRDPVQMLSASPALLQGKILRGGMGTGMPYWGPIFSESQTWAVVDFLYTFQFQYEGSESP